MFTYRMTQRLVGVAALLALASGLLFAVDSGAPAGAQATGGPVFVSGDDAEDHCEEDSCGGLYAAVLSRAISLSGSPGTGIAAIGVDDEDNASALESWNDPNFGGPDVPITVIMQAQIATVDFAAFDVIFVPSNEDDGEEEEVGLSNGELAALNARQGDIQDFVNNLGGGLIALTEADADPDLAFGFLPLQLEFDNVSYEDAEPTAAMAGLAPDADGDNMDHDSYHNVWTGPPGFGGLDVLAVTPEVLDENENPSAAILGGAQVVLSGLISLSPETATNPVGTEHTVTATVGLAEDPLVDVEVAFEVTEGPNAGEAATAATDANGEATFTYTGDGGAGTDTIEACFFDRRQQERCDTATKEWLEAPAPTATATSEPIVSVTPTSEVAGVTNAALPQAGAGGSDGGIVSPWLVLAPGALAGLGAAGALTLSARRR